MSCKFNGRSAIEILRNSAFGAAEIIAEPVSVNQRKTNTSPSDLRRFDTQIIAEPNPRKSAGTSKVNGKF